jgi:hypothetical protein
MNPQLYTVHDLENPAAIARGLSLPEAFARVMALSGRERWAFARTARTMHIVIFEAQPGDPSFESELAVDRAARNDIMAQVCAHGFGQFRVTPSDQQTQEEPRYAALA